MFPPLEDCGERRRPWPPLGPNPRPPPAKSGTREESAAGEADFARMPPRATAALCEPPGDPLPVKSLALLCGPPYDPFTVHFDPSPKRTTLPGSTSLGIPSAVRGFGHPLFLCDTFNARRFSPSSSRHAPTCFHTGLIPPPALTRRRPASSPKLLTGSPRPNLLQRLPEWR